ncbi:dienelactone hydrolase [Thermocatellispora tengchongensis]|uniref:Dienelactone hydrolase n=1 Tax=Thermocatellispora tengchongensis TaxID=1073253 RepID=A0A840NZJ4_9ACTN|nr:dienelactone hydrolase family protein [Thermocatellispora tengchongensis]MBB5132908.1 dienelactone hydrolase [Thermocatellispora tengchongensis]
MQTGAVVTVPVEYRHGSAVMEGLLLRGDATPAPAPTVLVCHGAEGRSDVLVEMAMRLLPWGYQAFVMDLYGKGVSGSTPEEFDALMRPFLEDRAMLADRLATVVSTVAELPEVDASRLAAIGFCFGGLCVLDMARTGAAVRGVASFHGVLTPPPGWTPRPTSCKVAVYHGWEDPFARPEDVTALAAELTAAGADWQFQVFGHTFHSFMAEQANSPELGIQYSRQSAERAWWSLERFLAECLRQPS